MSLKILEVLFQIEKALQACSLEGHCTTLSLLASSWQESCSKCVFNKELPP